MLEFSFCFVLIGYEVNIIQLAREKKLTGLKNQMINQMIMIRNIGTIPISSVSSSMRRMNGFAIRALKMRFRVDARVFILF